MVSKKPTTFAARLSELRRAARLSAKALSRRAGLAETTVGMLERRQREPSWDTVCKLARALGVGVEAFAA